MDNEHEEVRVASALRAATAQVWPSPELDARVADTLNAERPGRSRWIVPVIAAVTAVVLAATAVVVTAPHDPTGDRVVAARPGEDDGAGALEPFDAGPLATRGEPQAVWTGSEMIVVGGLAIEQYAAFADGAAYDPQAGTWRRIASRPDPGRIMVAAWTGSELFVLGQREGIELSDMRSAHLYDPKADSWRATSPPPGGLDAPEDAWWTGRSVLVWRAGTGILYDPATDTWDDIPPIDVPGAAAPGRATWIEGAGLLAVQGAMTPDSGGPLRPALFLFDPATGVWHQAAPAPEVIPQFNLTVAAWLGTELVFSPEPSGPTYAYDPSADRWRELATPAVARDRGTGYFTGVPLGAHGGVIRLGDSRRPLVVMGPDGAWAYPDTPAGAKVPAPDGATVWTGRELILWGRPADAGPTDGNAALRWIPGARPVPAPEVETPNTTAAGDAAEVPDEPRGVVSTEPTVGRGDAPPPPQTDTLSADFTAMFESGATGRGAAERTGGSSWKITITVEGTEPGTRHSVLVQHQLSDGGISQAKGLCDFTADGGGVGECSGLVDVGSGTLYGVTVGRYHADSGGYRSIASGEFRAG